MPKSSVLLLFLMTLNPDRTFSQTHSENTQTIRWWKVFDDTGYNSCESPWGDGKAVSSAILSSTLLT